MSCQQHHGFGVTDDGGLNLDETGEELGKEGTDSEGGLISSKEGSSVGMRVAEVTAAGVAVIAGMFFFQDLTKTKCYQRSISSIKS